MNRVIKQGKVVAIMQDEQFNEEVLIVKSEEETVYVLNSEAGVSNAINFIGLEVEYVHMEEVNGNQYASIIKLQMNALSLLKQAFEKNPLAEYLAEVMTVENNVASVKVNHCLAKLHRQDIICEPVTLNELIKVGEVLRVRIKLIQKEYIQVVAIDKKTVSSSFDITDLKENDLIYGIIERTKIIRKITKESKEKSNHAFVTIAKGLDALAPVQTHRNVKAGNEVIFKINQINSDGRVRGKILRVLNTKPVQIQSLLDKVNVGDVLTGKVKLLRYDMFLGESVLIMESQGHHIIIPFSELSSQDLAIQEINWLGQNISVKITEVSDRIFGSKKQQDEEEHQMFIKEWKYSPETIKHAYVKEIGSIGFILNIGRKEVFLLKADYRSIIGDPTEVVLSTKIYVQLKSIQDDIITVIPVSNHKKYELKLLGLTDEDFQPMKRGLLPIYEGVITKLMKKGAYLIVDGVRVFLPNTLFSLETTRVIDVYQVGDVIQVRMHAYKENNIIVCANTRYTKVSGLTREELKPGMLAHGVVRRVYELETNKIIDPSEGGQKVFTSIGFKLEGLSPNSSYFDVEEGDSVIYRVNQIREDGSIRGKIIRLLEI